MWRACSALTEFAMEQEDRHTRLDGDHQTQTALNFGARGFHTGRRTSRALTVRRPGPPPNRHHVRTAGLHRSVMVPEHVLCMPPRLPCQYACVRACVSAGGAVARRDAHTYGGTTCCMRARVQCNNAIGQRAIPATVVRAPTGRPVVAAGHGLCAVGAARVAVKASGRRAGVGRMWSDDVVAPAGGACRALRRVRSIPSRPAGWTDARFRSIDLSVKMGTCGTRLCRAAN